MKHGRAFKDHGHAAGASIPSEGFEADDLTDGMEPSLAEDRSPLDRQLDVHLQTVAGAQSADQVAVETGVAGTDVPGHGSLEGTRSPLGRFETDDDAQTHRQAPVSSAFAQGGHVGRTGMFSDLRVHDHDGSGTGSPLRLPPPLYSKRRAKTLKIPRI